ncbi:carbonic anhydrase family protein [Kiritimatiellaeota bacterium B1221]|nr:carbonic anhydrase family protein [Kiritimatiellaeota bacterium B1221]
MKNMLPEKFLVSVAILFFLGGCASHSPHGSESPHWSYEGASGPSHWGGLCDEYCLASEGKSQSPVDLTQGDVRRETLGFDYKPGTLNLVNNGHTIQQNMSDGALLIEDDTYKLIQFHFHSASEHTVAGKRFDMEIHLVHQNEAGEYAVLAVLLEEGEENSFLKTFFDVLPAEEGQVVKNDRVELNVAELFPKESSLFSYWGSLTTPPCTEGVHWYIFRKPVPLSAEQLKTFRSIYEGNFRPVRALNGRTIEIVTP